MNKFNASFAAGALLVGATSAFAQHHVEYGLALALGWDYYEHYEQGPLPTTPVIHELLAPGYGRVAGVANVGFGVNKARVDLTGTHADNPLNFDYGFASSRYFDALQFDDPELNGTHGFFEITLYVEGSGFANMSESLMQSIDTEFDAFWHAVINVSVDGVETETGPIQSTYYAGEWYKGFDETALNYYGDPLNTYQQTATIEFIYGQPIYMDTFLQVLTSFDNQTGVSGTIDSTIDLGNSAYWGGISNLRDASGNPVIGASYSSSSGFDYRPSAAPPAPGDANNDGVVNVADLLMVISAWGACPAAPAACPADFNDDNVVNVTDLLTVISNWG